VQEIANFYNGYWHHFRPFNLDKNFADTMIDDASHPNTPDVKLQRLEALLGGLQGKRVLDIGCGLGTFLIPLKIQGANVVGQDISSEAVTFLREQLAIEAHEDSLQDCASKIGLFNAISMNDLIEHPVNPLEILDVAQSLLLKNGLLLIWTPNGGAAGMRLESAKNWVGFQVDLEHLQYFSPQTIMWLSTHRGWVIEHLETTGYPNLTGVLKLASTKKQFNLQQYSVGLFKKIPGVRKTARLFRILRNEMLGLRSLDMRHGNYHLFAILRKPV
jgi:2-polyprenyl-3-methyl-5-hydroxy-6-metoxy-1,4-benzoquinol methylase